MSVRLDNLLVQQGLFTSRTRAQKAIKDGQVSDASGVVFSKPSELVEEDLQVVIEDTDQYVSRGALKLIKAIDDFGLSLAGKTVLDIGASTGGFTQVSLEHGAKHVYAIDVGHDQLVDILKEDSRVTNLEGYNFRYAKIEDFTNPVPDVAVMDVSFISQKLIFESLQNFDSIDQVVSLFKPQFEVGKVKLKNGIVKDYKMVTLAMKSLVDTNNEYGFYLKNFAVSPIKGGSGNTEFITKWTRENIDNFKFEDIIKSAY